MIVRGEIVYMPAAISCSRIASSLTVVRRPENRLPRRVASAETDALPRFVVEEDADIGVHLSAAAFRPIVDDGLHPLHGDVRPPCTATKDERHGHSGTERAESQKEVGRTIALRP